MVYMQLKTEDPSGIPTLSCVCRACGSTAAMGKDQCSTSVFSANYGDDHTAYKLYMMEHIRSDPTLPHADNIQCVNDKCTRVPSEPPDVVFIKYDAQRMKFLYHCTHCREFWKSGGGE
jgi:hypothetical protein